MTVSRRFLLTGLLSGLACPALADAPLRPVARPSSLAGDVVPVRAAVDTRALVDAAGLGGKTGFALADARTGELLQGFAADEALPPASTAKSLTSLFALERLGSAYRFSTRLVATGEVAGGIVQGDLVLAGSGDPVLDTDQLGDLAAALKAAGVRGVKGRFLVWEGALPTVDRISEDQPDHVGYNPAVSGLNLNYNRVHFEWKRAGGNWGVAMDARGQRYVPPVRMARMEVVNREAPLFTYRARAGREDWTVASAALGKGGSRWLPVRRPGQYAGEVFQTLARAQGIDLPQPETIRSLPAGRVIATHGSDPLTTILRGMLRHSTNLTAEAVGLTASGAASLSGSGAAMSGWIGDRLGAKARFVDHSGLGASSRISPAQFVRALYAAQGLPSGPVLKTVLRDLGMSDDEGGAIESPVKVIGKTGTLNFVSTLVGYIQPPSGREMVFAILSADTARRDRLSVDERERPQGGRAWLKRARRLQGQLISTWAGQYA